MDLRPSEEQAAVGEVARAALADAVSPGSEPLPPADFWQLIAGDLQLTGALAPETFGGAGMRVIDLMPAVEQLGAALAPTTFLDSAVVATSLLVESKDEETAARLLPAMASGDLVVGVELGHRPGAAELTARQADGGWQVTGVTGLISGGESADVLLAFALAGGQPALFAVSLPSDRVVVAARSQFDPSDPAVALELRDALASPVRVVGDVARLQSRARDLAAAAFAVDQVGGAQRCLDLAVEHARSREQFGRPIGSFQAVKHACADALIAVEAARAAALHAAWAADADPEAFSRSARMAKALASDAYVLAADTCAQVHGGIGFTWEHPAHRYQKRARASALRHGTATEHRSSLAADAQHDIAAQEGSA